MSQYLSGFLSSSVLRLYGSMPLYWQQLGPTDINPTKLRSVVVQIGLILYQLLHGNNSLLIKLIAVMHLVKTFGVFKCHYCWTSHRFKFPYPLQWGPPTFAAGHSVAMMAAVFVSMIEVPKPCSYGTYFPLFPWLDPKLHFIA